MRRGGFPDDPGRQPAGQGHGAPAPEKALNDRKKRSAPELFAGGGSFVLCWKGLPAQERKKPCK